MGKVVGLLLFLTVVGVSGFYLIKTYLPNLAPPSKNIKLYLPLNSDTPSPLKIVNDYKMDLYADLKGELPVSLAIGPDDVLYVALSNTNKIIAFPNKNQFTVLDDVKKIKSMTIYNGYIYLIEDKVVSRYLLDTRVYKGSSMEILLDFTSDTNFDPSDLAIKEDKLYLTDGVRIFSTGLDNLSLIEEYTYTNTVFMSKDGGDNLFTIKDNKIIKHPTFAGNITNEIHFVSGFTQDNGDKLGNIVDLTIDPYGNIYVGDNQTALIYIISK